MSDWIKIHRRLIDSRVFSDPVTLKIWIWLLLKANYKDTCASLKTGKGYQDVDLKRGTILFGRNKAEEILNMNPSLIYRHIKKLETYGNILVKSNNHYSIITICKYDSYQYILGNNEQGTGQAIGQQIGQPIEQPIGQPANTYKKVNKENKNTIVKTGEKNEKKSNVVELNPTSGFGILSKAIIGGNGKSK